MQLDTLCNYLDDTSSAGAWLQSIGLARIDSGHRNLVMMAEAGVPLDLLANLCEQFAAAAPALADRDMAWNNLERFVSSARNPLSTTALFERDAEALHIKEDRFERDLHIHVPAGAIPKDGPSAGITMATALVSSLSERPVRHDLAMTGEITLNGRVLPIGGVKEKILGGVRAGIRTFLLPKANEADLEDLPQEVLRSIRVVPVQELGEVLALALRDASFREGRLLFGDQRPEDVVPLSSSHLEH